MKKWTEKELVLAVANMFGWRKFTIVPNVMGILGHRAEIDLVVLDNKTWLAREVEIKLSRADFLADKKKKYQHDSIMFKYFYYALPTELYPEVVDLIPENAGVILVSQKEYYWQEELRKYIETTVKVKPKAKAIFRQWEASEALRLAQLGSLRYWYQVQDERRKAAEAERHEAGK